jgi:thiamine-phosphate pyrophosphorylase
MPLQAAQPRTYPTLAGHNVSKPTLTYPVLCLITDPSLPDLLAKVEIALSAGVNMLQLRGHTLPAAELYRLALQLRPLCQHYQATFIINNRIDVGLATGVDGFQLGARSLPLAAARQLVGEDYLLGTSVHSCEEALVARTGGTDFLLAGTIFASHTHPGEPPNGTGLLQSIKQLLPDAPLLAIGGITPTNARQAMQAGADGIAVITAILHAPDIQQATHNLRTAITS